MKNWSGHIQFDDKFEWKDLSKAFPEIWEIITKESKLNLEDANYDQLNLDLNMKEIGKNKKPYGYLRDGAKFRLIFPIDQKEMIVYRGMPSEQIKDLTEAIAKVLKSKKIKFTIAYDKMILIDVKSRRRYG